MDELDDEERRARIALMAAETQSKLADVENKQADTRLKLQQARWEPWKAISAAIGAGIAIAVGLMTLGGLLFSHFGH